MVDKFPYEISADVAKGPVLKGRASLQMVIRTRNNPNLPTITFDLVVDGYNAPVTAGNFVDLVQRNFYDGMEIQRGEPTCPPLLLLLPSCTLLVHSRVSRL